MCKTGGNRSYETKLDCSANKGTVRPGCAARAGCCVEPEASPRRAWLARKRGETHGLDGAELMSSAESVGPATSLVHLRAAGVAAGAFSERASPSSSVSASSNSDSSSAKSGEVREVKRL